MASKRKLTVSIDEALARDLEAASRQSRRPRSNIVEEALQLWRRRRLEVELKNGYLAMAKENRACAEASLAAEWETIIERSRARCRPGEGISTDEMRRRLKRHRRR